MTKSFLIRFLKAIVPLLCAAVVICLSVPALDSVQLPIATESQAADVVRPPSTNAASAAKLPRLVDLGADKCIPCKMMTAILDNLKSDFEGQMQVDFIDVWKDPEAAKPYRIRLIPTQIFYDANGKELFRHEGVFSRADILAKWKEHGITFKEKAPRPAKPAGKP